MQNPLFRHSQYDWNATKNKRIGVPWEIEVLEVGPPQKESTTKLEFEIQCYSTDETKWKTKASSIIGYKRNESGDLEKKIAEYLRCLAINPYLLDVRNVIPVFISSPVAPFEKRTLVDVQNVKRSGQSFLWQKPELVAVPQRQRIKGCNILKGIAV